MSYYTRTITMIGTILDYSIIDKYNDIYDDEDVFYDHHIKFILNGNMNTGDFFIAPDVMSGNVVFAGIIITKSDFVKIEDIPELAEKAKREIKRVLQIDVDEVELIVFDYTR